MDLNQDKNLSLLESTFSPTFSPSSIKIFEDINNKMLSITIQASNTIFLLNKTLHNSPAILKGLLPLSLMYMNYLSPCQRFQPLAPLKV